MKIKINTSKMNGKVTKGMEDAAYERLKKIEEFLKEDETVKIAIESLKKNKVAVTIQVVLPDNHHMKMTIIDEDYYSALNSLEDDLKRSIRKHKEKYEGRKERRPKLARLDNESEITLDEPLPKISKIKQFKLDSITESMAIAEMEQTGHDQYIFKNANANDKICMMYKRLDGDYGLIITE